MTDSNDILTENFVFNGLDGASGEYLIPPMSAAQLSKIALGQSLDPEEIKELENRKFTLNNPHAGVEADQRVLSETGWGIIFTHDADPALLEALAPLLKLRQEQAGERFKVFTGGEGYRPGESKNAFLKRHKMGSGPVNPDKVPYYLLLVGSPEKIPYRFQYQLDVQYAVGRIYFENLEEYAYYAQSVVTSEKGLKLAPQAVFFGVANEDDLATNMSHDYLIQPLATKLRQEIPQWAAAGRGSAVEWKIDSFLKDEATKANLNKIFNGNQAPALFFSASHGIGFPHGHSHQLPHQGALVCQDWPGRQNWQGPIKPDFYFAGEDLLTSEANMLGSIAFFFACYGAGTPKFDEFAHHVQRQGSEPKFIAPHDFVARLPQKMLSLPRGGALAAIGHIERAWGVSFYLDGAGPQFQVFEDCFERLLKGNYPIGYAAEVFNNRYAELSSDLSVEIEEVNIYNKKPDQRQLANMWTANNDARNYIILGDPAVRLSVSASNSGTHDRPEIPEISSIPGESIQPEEQTPEAKTATGDQPVLAAGTEAAIDYGLIDSFRQAQTSVGSALEKFVDKLGGFLSQALDEASSLEVATYVSRDMDSVRYENGRFSGAQLRALTRVEIDGDTLVCVPEVDGEVDTELWEIHLEMLQQAQSSRSELLQTVVSAATNLVELIKP